MNFRLIESNGNTHYFEYDCTMWQCNVEEHFFDHAELLCKRVDSVKEFIFSSDHQRVKIIATGTPVNLSRDGGLLTAMYKFETKSDYVEFFKTILRQVESQGKVTQLSLGPLRKQLKDLSIRCDALTSQTELMAENYAHVSVDVAKLRELIDPRKTHIPKVALIRIMQDENGIRAGITIAPGIPEFIMEFKETNWFSGHGGQIIWLSNGAFTARKDPLKIVEPYKFLAKSGTNLRATCPLMMTLPQSVVTIYENYGGDPAVISTYFRHEADGSVNIVRGTYGNAPAFVTSISPSNPIIIIGTLAMKFQQHIPSEGYKFDKYVYTHCRCILDPTMKETDPLKLAEHYVYKAGYEVEWLEVIEKTKQYRLN